MDTNLSPKARERIAQLLRKHAFIEAVKVYRSTTGCNLRAAKEAVEQIEQSLGIRRPSLLKGLYQDFAGPLLLVAVTIVVITAIWLLTR